MRRLSSLIAVFCWVLSVCAQSPHGEELKISKSEIVQDELDEIDELKVKKEAKEYTT